MNSTMTEEALKKMTVPQLKALCKDRHITGYSKLGKMAIIQRLLDTGRTHDLSVNGAFSAVPTTARDGNVSENAPTISQTSTRPLQPLRSLDNSPVLLPTSTVSPRSTKDVLPFASGTAIKGPSMEVLLDMSKTAAPRKRPLPTLSPGPGTPRKYICIDVVRDNTSLQHPTSAQFSASSTALPNQMEGIRKSSTNQDNTQSTRSFTATNATCESLSNQNIRTGQAKRFIPLQIKKMPRSGEMNASFRDDSAVSDSTLSKSTWSDGILNTECQLWYLDFPLPKTLSLQPIALPPRLSETKRASQLAVILRDIAATDLPACALVSRAFRYAVYMSAAHRLMRYFPGKRLDKILQQNSLNVINLWPYLRLRQSEVRRCKQAFAASLLAQALQGTGCVASHLWTSPDNEKQITVVLRFLLTRLSFAVSVGQVHNLDSWVTSADEVIKEEIWHITTQIGLTTESFYVLEATCEVVGRPSADEPGFSNDSSLLRADWSAYIKAKLGDISNMSLLEHIKWPNHEEYERGISRLWLKRISQEGEVGAAKRLVATRYILASAMSNSISGPWMSSMQMAQEFNGMYTKEHSSIARPHPIKRINIFVPLQASDEGEHRIHHVESLHFATVDRRVLHPALASVQTPHREYIILRDNGMQVGCEEDGVAHVWRHILACDALGRPVDQ